MEQSKAEARDHAVPRGCLLGEKVAEEHCFSVPRQERVDHPVENAETEEVRPDQGGALAVEGADKTGHLLLELTLGPGEPEGEG